MAKKPKTSAETRHDVFVAAGHKGGHTGVKTTVAARRQRLINLGAEVGPDGHLIEGPATTLARQRAADALRLARAQARHKAQKAEERAAQQGQADEGPLA